jgi:pimeloyl-ACP methyl ester carboxylesterase
MTGLAVVERPPLGDGPARGAVVILVHGSMDRASSFRRVATRLPEATVIAYDRRGYAGSGEVRPSTRIDDHVSDLFDILDGRTAVAVGHSFGGDVVLRAAERRPDLIPSAMVYENPQPWLGSRPASSTGSRALAQAGEDPGRAAEIFMRGMVGDVRWERLPQSIRQKRRDEGPALIADLRAVRTGTAPFDVRMIQIPVICGYGTRSKDHHRDDTRTLASILPRGELHAIPGCGHGAHLSHPEEFAALIRLAIDRR